VIAGKYQIAKVLGEGGMGVVYEATHLRLRQRVAVKMLLPDMLSHEVIVTRFEREARAAGQLRSRHVARVMDVDVTADGLPYMVMEYLEGHDLEAELQRRTSFPWEEAVDYVLQACAAMSEAHQVGIVHRDLKPSNLFLANDGEARVVKVLDFGISKVQSEGDAKLTSEESVMGTAMYMSPEQVRSTGTVDRRSDIWSLGVILYELLAGRPPWIGTPTQLAAAIVSEDPPELRGLVSIPAELSAVVTRALQRNVEARFGDVRELALALAPFAPPGGLGRAIADAFRGGAPAAGSGSWPQVSIRPARADESAATVVQSNAVSESRLRSPDANTATGWSQQPAPSARTRTLVLGIAGAFVVGLVVLGGGAALFLRGRDGGQAPTATAGAAGSAALPAAAPTIEPATAASSAPSGAPAASTSEASAASAAAASAATSTSADARPAKPAPKPLASATATATSGKPATKPPPSKPAPAATNPTLL